MASTYNVPYGFFIYGNNQFDSPISAENGMGRETFGGYDFRASAVIPSIKLNICWLVVSIIISNQRHISANIKSLLTAVDSARYADGKSNLGVVLNEGDIIDLSKTDKLATISSDCASMASTYNVVVINIIKVNIKCLN